MWLKDMNVAWPSVSSDCFTVAFSGDPGMATNGTDICILLPVRKTIKKTLVVSLFLAAAWLCNTLALAWIHEKTPESDELPDIIFSLIPNLPWTIKVAEACVLVNGISALLAVMLHPQRALLVPRTFFLAGLLYFGRAICMSVTLLPVPNRQRFCEPKLNHTNWQVITGRVVMKIFHLGLQSPETRQACGDFIYSGHTITLCLAYLTLKAYLPKKVSALSHLVGVLALIGMVLVVVSRIHYTIDVLLAYYFTTRLFSWYQLTVINSKLYENITDDYADLISRILWYPMVRFIENGDRPQQGPKEKAEDYRTVPLLDLDDQNPV